MSEASDVTNASCDAVTAEAINIDADQLKRLKQAIADRCIVRWSGQSQIRSRSGKRFEWYLDLRPVLLGGPSLAVIARLFWSRMAQFWPFQVAGLEVGAVPLLAAIALEGEHSGLDVRALIVRQKRKKYGTMRTVEGDYTVDLPVIIVDDSLNSGRSVNKVLVAVREVQLHVQHAFVVVNFASTAAGQWSRENKITVDYLFTPADFGLESEKLPVTNSTSYDLVWTFASPMPNYQFAVAKSTPVIYKDLIMFGSDCGIFWCLEKANGRIRWFYKTPDKTGKGILSSPVLAGDKVYFGSYSGGLFCLDAFTGTPVWSVQRASWIGSSPCYAGESIYVGMEYSGRGFKGGLAKFCAKTGQLAWEVPTRRMLHGSPVFSDDYGQVIVGTNDSTVLAIDGESGEVKQFLKVGGPVKYHCALRGSLAVFGSFDGKIYVWDFIDNNILLTVQTEDIVYSRPLIVDERGFIGCADGTLRVIDLNELCQLGSIDVGEKVHSSPSLLGDAVFLGTSGGELVSLDPVSLKVTYRTQFPERLTNTVISDDDLLYVYAYDNKMWAIALPNLADSRFKSNEASLRSRSEGSRWHM
jgi:outer membrane protein assembly factor BamB